MLARQQRSLERLGFFGQGVRRMFGKERFDRRDRIGTSGSRERLLGFGALPGLGFEAAALLGGALLGFLCGVTLARFLLGLPCRFRFLQTAAVRFGAFPRFLLGLAPERFLRGAPRPVLLPSA